MPPHCLAMLLGAMCEICHRKDNCQKSGGGGEKLPGADRISSGWRRWEMLPSVLKAPDLFKEMTAKLGGKWVNSTHCVQYELSLNINTAFQSAINVIAHEERKDKCEGECQS